MPTTNLYNKQKLTAIHTHHNPFVYTHKDNSNTRVTLFTEQEPGIIITLANDI
jgi:hypothetical protein